MYLLNDDLDTWIKQKSWYPRGHRIFFYHAASQSIKIDYKLLPQYKDATKYNQIQIDQIDMYLIDAIIHILKLYRYPDITFAGCTRKLIYDKKFNTYHGC